MMSRRARNKAKTKWRFGRIFSFLLIIFVAAYVLISYRLPLPVLAAQPVGQADLTATNPTLPWPAYGGSAIGAVGYGLLAEHDAEKPIPTASTAKTMTALAVLHAKPLTPGDQGPTITLSSKDVGYFDYYFSRGGSLVRVTAGEKITEYQALEALMLPSANNMAKSLADWAFGSQSGYLNFASGFAAKLGMHNSRFTDASGFDPSTKASPADMIKLGIAAIQNPVLAQIVSKKSATIPAAGTIRNVNWLLGMHSIDGIKTGSTDQDGGAFLFAAPKTYPTGQKITVVGVVMGAKTLNRAMTDSLPLLQATQKNFKPTTIITKGQIVGSYDIPWGDKVDAVAATSLTMLTWPGQPVKPSVSLNQIKANTAKGTQVGMITINSEPKQTIPVVVNEPIVQPTWYWRLTRHF